MRVSAAIFAIAFAACARQEAPPTETQPELAAQAHADAERTAQLALLDAYFAAYKSKDVEAILAAFDADVVGVLYPATLFGRGIEAARSGIEGDFAARPNSWADMPRRYRIARDKWATFGDSVNGEERAPLMIVFDLNEAGDRIEGTYTLIGHAQFIDGASVGEPTAVMRENFTAIRAALTAGEFSAAAAFMAPGATLYAYPPSSLENVGPLIAGASDVASVLSFKWGEGAWGEEGAPREDLFVSQFMQFVFVGIPGEGLDRAALFTFGADAAASSYERVTRVDVMGPSGG